MSDSTQRVVITGLGVISPIGCDLASFWNSLQSGVSGIAKMETIPEGTIQVKHGAESRGFTGAIEDFGPLDKALQRNIRKGQKVMCREIEMGVAACQLALTDSGLGEAQRNPERTGIVYGCDYILTRPEEFIDGIVACRDEQKAFHIDRWPVDGLPKVNPLWLLKYLPNMPASHVAIYNDLRGPSNSLTVREASNNLSLAEATAVIRRGVADAMLVGSTGSYIHPLRSLHASGQVTLARDRSNPAEMSRPFDADRDGMVLGEGAGAMVIESLESAQRRGAKIYGEVVATAASTVGPRPGRDHVRLAISNIVRGLSERAGDALSGKWHLHAAGRGDVDNDASEAMGIRDAIGSQANSVPVVAAKSYFGNLGAGGAAVELIASIMALQHGELFPTLNYQKPDPKCPLQVAANAAPAGTAFMHLSYSPQGQASSALIRSFS